MTYIPELSGTVDANNSTTTPLGSGETFTGTGTDVSQYHDGSVVVTAAADVDGTLAAQFSSDNSDWSVVQRTTDLTASNDGLVRLALPVLAKYFRVVFTNGASAQGSFRLRSLLKSTAEASEAVAKSGLRVASMNTGTTDAFARLRISKPVTVMEFNQVTFASPDILSEALVGSGSSTYSQSTSSTALAVTTSGDSAARQTIMRSSHQPGKGLLVSLSGTLNARTGGNQSGTVARIGFFDADDGYYFEYDGSDETVYAVRLQNDVVTARVAQGSWALDTMDGLGASGANLDWTKAQTFFFDLDGLSVGRVRYGFYFGGVPIYCHQITHQNAAATASVRRSSLPLRFEVASTGGAAELTQICGAITSEGGYQLKGKQFAHWPEDSFSITTTRECVAAFRLRSGVYRKSMVLPQVIRTLADANTDFVVEVWIFRGTASSSLFSGSPTWTAVDANLSAVEATPNPTLTTTTVAGLQAIGSGTRHHLFFTKRESTHTLSTDLQSDFVLGANVDESESDILVVTAQTTNSRGNMVIGFNWIEIT